MENRHIEVDECTPRPLVFITDHAFHLEMRADVGYMCLTSSEDIINLLKRQSAWIVDTIVLVGNENGYRESTCLQFLHPIKDAFIETP